MATVKTNVIQIDTAPAAKSIKELRNEIKDLKDQMAGLDSSSDAFIEAANKAGELQHQVDEISQAVRGASSDFGDMLGNVSKVGAGLTGAFQTAAAAMNLFGVESSNVTKAIQKMQSLMAITQGLSAIDNGIKAWKKFSAAIQTTTIYQNLFNKSLKQTTIDSKAASTSTTGLSGAMKANAASTTAATVATRAFGMALKAIGIGLIIAAINLLIEGLKKLIDWFKSFNSEEDRFTSRLNKLNLNLKEFRNNLETSKNIAEFALSMRKGWIEIEKMNNELQKLNINFQTYLGIQDKLNGLYTASGIDNTVAQFELVRQSFSQLNDMINTLVENPILGNSLKEKLRRYFKGRDQGERNLIEGLNPNNGYNPLNVPEIKQYEELERSIRSLKDSLSGLDGTLAKLEKKKNALVGISNIIKNAANDQRNLTEAEKASITNLIDLDHTEQFITSLQKDYAEIVKVKGKAQKEIDSLNRMISDYGDDMSNTDIKSIEQKIKLLESFIEYLDETKNQITSYTTAYNSALIDIASLELQMDQNAKNLSKEQAEIFREQIEGKAARDEMYKSSINYLQDQIKYQNMLLALEQKGTSNYEKIQQTILNLRYQIRMLYKDLTPSKSSITGVFIDPKFDKDMQDKIKTALENLDKIVIPHITTWKDTLRELIYDVGHQFEVLTNTLSLYQESTLGLSGNYINAANDIKKTFDKLMQNIIDGGDAGWTQWSQSAGMAFQAAGSMMNALSAEQNTASEEGFESQKKLQIGATVMNMLSGIMMAWSTAMELGPIAGPIAGAINSAMIAGIGAAQIAKIKGTTFGGGADSGGYSTSGVGSLIAPIQYTATVADASKERDVRDTRVYVTEHDITDTQRRVQVAQSEARF